MRRQKRKCRGHKQSPYAMHPGFERLEDRRLLSGGSLLEEPNDTIPEAAEVVLSASSPVTVSGSLRDSGGRDDLDQDIAKFQLAEGDTVEITNPEADYQRMEGIFEPVNLVLRLFNADGSELAIDWGVAGSTGISGPKISYTAEAAGTYYLGVTHGPDTLLNRNAQSGLTYDPFIADSGTGFRVRYGVYPSYRFFDKSLISSYEIRLELDGEGPDIDATSLDWNSEQNGLDFRYEVAREDLTDDTTAAVYWARGEEFDAESVIGGAIRPISIEKTVGEYGPVFVPGSDLGAPPEDVQYLLLVVDPPSDGMERGIVEEAEESNNVFVLPLFDIEMISATTTDFEEIRFEYRISRSEAADAPLIAGADAPPFDLRFYLSANEEFDIGTDGDPFFEGTINAREARIAGEEPHTKSIPLPSRANISEAKRFVLVVVDPENKIPDTNRDNNVAFVVPLFTNGQKMDRTDKTPGSCNWPADEIATTASGPPHGGDGWIVPYSQPYQLLSYLGPYWLSEPEFGFYSVPDDPLTFHDDLAQGTLRTPISDLRALIRADERLNSDFWGDARFSVNEAFSWDPAHDEQSLHKQARALDLGLRTQALLRIVDTQRRTRLFGRLAGLAWLAGFDFVWFEDSNHVHVSSVPQTEPEIPLTDEPFTTLQLNSPANLFVTDPAGNQSGVDPTTGNTLLEIPGTVFSGLGTHPQTLTIMDVAEGTYTVQVLGTDAGSYTLDLLAIDTYSRVVHTRVSDSTSTGAMTTYSLDLIRDNVSQMRLLGDRNLPPVAFPDTASAGDSSVLIDVLGNDSDPEGNLNPATVVVATPPAHGTVDVSPETGQVT